MQALIFLYTILWPPLLASVTALDLASPINRRHLLATSAAIVGASPTTVWASHEQQTNSTSTTTLKETIEYELASARQIPWSLNPSSSTTPGSPFSALRYGTSSLGSRSQVPNGANAPLYYPSWMAGTWLVKYKFATASFPQGKGALSLRVPGAGLATCLSIPNVGYNPAPFTIRFHQAVGGQGVYEDLAYNMPRHLEAFWPQAQVTSVRTGAQDGLSPPCSVTGDGCTNKENPNLHSPATRVVLEYEGPTKAGPRRVQTIDETAVGGLCVPDGSSGVFSSRQFVQYNVQQELQTYFKEMAKLTSVDDGVVDGTLRVAGYLPYQENISGSLSNKKYDEALALATYTYKLALERLSEAEATLI